MELRPILEDYINIIKEQTVNPDSTSYVGVNNDVSVAPCVGWSEGLYTEGVPWTFEDDFGNSQPGTTTSSGAFIPDLCQLEETIYVPSLVDATQLEVINHMITTNNLTQLFNRVIFPSTYGGSPAFFEENMGFCKDPETGYAYKAFTNYMVSLAGITSPTTVWRLQNLYDLIVEETDVDMETLLNIENLEELDALLDSQLNAFCSTAGGSSCNIRCYCMCDSNDCGEICTEETYDIQGCMDENALNYNPEATWDMYWDCEYPEFEFDYDFCYSGLMDAETGWGQWFQYPQDLDSAEATTGNFCTNFCSSQGQTNPNWLDFCLNCCDCEQGPASGWNTSVYPNGLNWTQVGFYGGDCNDEINPETTETTYGCDTFVDFISFIETDGLGFAPSGEQTITGGELVLLDHTPEGICSTCEQYGDIFNTYLSLYNWIDGTSPCDCCTTNTEVDEINCENFVQEIQSNSPELEDIGDGLDDADAFCLACADEPEIIPDSHTSYCDCCDDSYFVDDEIVDDEIVDDEVVDDEVVDDEIVDDEVVDDETASTGCTGVNEEAFNYTSDVVRTGICSMCQNEDSTYVTTHPLFASWAYQDGGLDVGICDCCFPALELPVDDDETIEVEEIEFGCADFNNEWIQDNINTLPGVGAGFPSTQWFCDACTCALEGAGTHQPGFNLPCGEVFYNHMMNAGWDPTPQCECCDGFTGFEESEELEDEIVTSTTSDTTPTCTTDMFSYSMNSGCYTVSQGFCDAANSSAVSLLFWVSEEECCEHAIQNNYQNAEEHCGGGVLQEEIIRIKKLMKK